MAASANEPILRLPVTKTGVYHNEPARRLEFYFCLYGKKALIGACNTDLPPSVKHQWARTTREQLTRMLMDAVEQAALIRASEEKALEKRLY